MKIRTGLSAGPDLWLAVDDDTYDAADTIYSHMIGYGATEEAAVLDLLRLMQEEAEYREDLAEGKHAL